MGKAPNDPKYTFGFTGFKPAEYWVEVEEEDEFDDWAREVRIKNGLPVPEKPKRRIKVTTEVLWSGNIVIPNPRFHRMITGIDVDGRTGQADSDNTEVHKEEQK